MYFITLTITKSEIFTIYSSKFQKKADRAKRFPALRQENGIPLILHLFHSFFLSHTSPNCKIPAHKGEVITHAEV